MRVLLFSGGIDSTALAHWTRPDVLLTIDYGQRTAGGEIRAATHIASLLGLQHEVVRVDCSALGLGHMAGLPPSPLGAAPEWWPYRNQLLITVAGMKFAPHGLSEIVIGTVASDVVHADGRPGFLKAIGALMSFQEGGVRVTAPASQLQSEELVRLSGVSMSVLAWTFSCHVSVHACGQCRGCQKHLITLEALGALERD
ncbi:7-cyano-7-deazaguanine synthase [Azospirillum sp. YIM DDC1]|uniref:7-cyano-7-deazaguanine synthase n=1 Tax=Azospirillum aestuarii TaxID=2802052 RepID=A0ABS1I7P3_9PROT|nr:7-cyano-7-deazaguanine synthase [Azospirillum aestuarii]MBK4723073.1 7-cyano-7-deazaguanine synthase [Azospirillum aestuarii]